MSDVPAKTERRRRMGLITLLAAGFMAAAAVSGIVATAELRAGDAATAVARAGDSPALGWRAPSGDLLELAAARALLQEPPDLDAAEALSWDALRRSPARAESWARLAYIDAARDGRLDAPGQEALARSYAAAPYTVEALRRWRAEFTLSRWGEVDDELRQAALREARGATADGARWFEESLWMWELAERLEPEAREALLAATARIH
jgi:hypothetical protein